LKIGNEAKFMLHKIENRKTKTSPQRGVIGTYKRWRSPEYFDFTLWWPWMYSMRSSINVRGPLSCYIHILEIHKRPKVRTHFPFLNVARGFTHQFFCSKTNLKIWQMYLDNVHVYTTVWILFSKKRTFFLVISSET
jgi:hypothetical protein